MIKEDLKEYGLKKKNLGYLKDEIERLNALKYDTPNIWTGSDPVKGGGSKQEDRLLDINCRLHKLQQNHDENMKMFENMERGLNQLTELENKIVNKLWIERKSVEKVARELHMSKATIYRRSDEALKTLAICIYGG